MEEKEEEKKHRKRKNRTLACSPSEVSFSSDSLSPTSSFSLSSTYHSVSSVSSQEQASRSPACFSFSSLQAFPPSTQNSSPESTIPMGLCVPRVRVCTHEWNIPAVRLSLCASFVASCSIDSSIRLTRAQPPPPICQVSSSDESTETTCSSSSSHRRRKEGKKIADDLGGRRDPHRIKIDQQKNLEGYSPASITRRTPAEGEEDDHELVKTERHGRAQLKTKEEKEKRDEERADMQTDFFLPLGQHRRKKEKTQKDLCERGGEAPSSSFSSSSSLKKKQGEDESDGEKEEDKKTTAELEGSSANLDEMESPEPLNEREKRIRPGESGSRKREEESTDSMRETEQGRRDDRSRGGSDRRRRRLTKKALKDTEEAEEQLTEEEDENDEREKRQEKREEEKEKEEEIGEVLAVHRISGWAWNVQWLDRSKLGSFDWDDVRVFFSSITSALLAFLEDVDLFLSLSLSWK